MAQVSVNGLAVISGTISLPVKGAWVADLEVDSDDTLPLGQRAVTIDLGDQDLIGTVAVDRQGVYAGKLTVRIVGGGHGLSKVLAARKYRGVPASIPLADILAETGELLASGVTLTLPLLHWARPRGPASSALEHLLATAGASWRIQPDGKLWVGTDTYPTTTATPEVIEERHGGNWRLLSPDAGNLLPGTTLLGKQLATVVYRIKPDAYRAEAWAA